MNAELSSARLRFRRFERTDAETLARLLNDIEISKWISTMPHPYTVDMAKEYLDAVLASDEPIYALEYEGSLSGAISTNDMLGFWLAPAHWGQGLITEACEVIIADHFAQGASLLLSAYHDGNVASQRVHAKLGFKTNGTSEVFSQALNVHVLRQDLILTRDDWEARA